MASILSSEYIGITSLPEIKKTDNYFKLEDTLKIMYDYYKKNPSTNKCYPELSIYKYMQGVNDNRRTDWNHVASKDMDSLMESFKPDWNYIRSDGTSSKHWHYVSAHKQERVFILDAVKIYVSVPEGAIKDLFLGVIEEMLFKANYSFDAKVSKRIRKDTMCFLVHGNDFSVLEDYFKCKEDLLDTSIKFIAYRNKLGVSRELSFNTYNQQIAILITDYFNLLQSCNEVSLVQMYRLFVDAWLGKPCLCQDRIDNYCSMPAQSLVVILEVLDVLLGRRTLTDDHILLSSDQEFWRPLYDCRDWEV